MITSNEGVQVSGGSYSSESLGSNSSSHGLAQPLLHLQQPTADTQRKCCRVYLTGMDWKLSLAGLVLFMSANVLVLVLVPDPSVHSPSERQSEQTFCFTVLYYPIMRLRTPIFNVRVHRPHNNLFPRALCISSGFAYLIHAYACTASR